MAISSSSAEETSAHLDPSAASVERAVDGVDQALNGNIDGYIHGGVHGFYQKYFENTTWSSAARRFVQESRPTIVNGCWAACPERPSPGELFTLICAARSMCSGGRGVWSMLPRGASESSRQQFKTHLIFTLEAVSSEIEHPWESAQVTGEFCDVSIDYQDGFSHLLRLVQKVFSSQPTRLFVPGFYVRGTLMELWMFDRSGVYSAKVFDIRKDPERFLNILVGYSLMSDKELGMTSLFHKDETGRYMTMRAHDEIVAQRLYLDPRPIATSHDIVGEGTTCYRAKRLDSKVPEYIIKFKWRLSDKRPEETLMKLAQERNVSGVVQLFGYQDLSSTGSLRRGLHFDSSRRFLPGTSHASDTKPTKPSEESQGAKSDLDDSQGDDALGVLKYTVEEEKCKSEQKSHETDEPFAERTFSCVVTFPAGRPLLKYKCVLELLEAIRDAIKGHRSLYQHGKILHQDISIDNIIIIEAAAKGDPKGILIDFDVAMDLAIGPSKPGELFGTRPFMGIALLRGKLHTYRHDLESFLFVFLWAAICGRASQVPATSRLRQWSIGDWGDLAQKKTYDMRKENFERITAKFTTEFQGLEELADDLRQVLFPIRDGFVWIETDASAEGVDRLYDGVINAFNKAIELYPSSRGML